MRLSVELKFEQLLAFVSQLPLREKKRLVKAVMQDIVQHEKAPTNLQKLLLAGPTWSDEEYNAFLEAQAQVNQIGKDAAN
jgi:chemotaxis regulatin CheY-phosphate phosphatase CheZ